MRGLLDPRAGLGLSYLRQPHRRASNFVAGRALRLIWRGRRALRHACLHTKILGYNHNWSVHLNDGGRPDDRVNAQYEVAAQQRSGAP